MTRTSLAIPVIVLSLIAALSPRANAQICVENYHAHEYFVPPHVHECEPDPSPYRYYEEPDFCYEEIDGIHTRIRRHRSVIHGFVDTLRILLTRPKPAPVPLPGYRGESLPYEGNTQGIDERTRQFNPNDSERWQREHPETTPEKRAIRKSKTRTESPRSDSSYRRPKVKSEKTAPQTKAGSTSSIPNADAARTGIESPRKNQKNPAATRPGARVEDRKTPTPIKDSKPKVDIRKSPQSKIDPNSTYPYGVPIPDREGLVYSPYTDENQMVDVRGIPSGSLAKCPYSNKIFRVP